MTLKRADHASRFNPGGNERLTAAVGLLVLAPILVEIATVLLGVHTFMSWHIFVGLALIPAVLLKLASTGWRFARYYTRNQAYVALGSPQLAMRLLAPLFVAATAARPPRPARPRLPRTRAQPHCRRCAARQAATPLRSKGTRVRGRSRRDRRSCARSRNRAGTAPLGQSPPRPSRPPGRTNVDRRPRARSDRLACGRGVREPWPDRSARLADLSRDDELRPQRRAALGA